MTPAESAKPRTKVGAVVLNYRNYGDTIDCLAALSRAQYDDLEIVVVDNYSGNDSLDHIAGYLEASGVPYHRLHQDVLDSATTRSESLFLVQASKNWGYAAGNNIGMRLLLSRGAGYILILNNDTMVEPGFLTPLVAYAESRPDVGAVGPLIVDPRGEIARDCARRRPTLGDFVFRLGIGRKLFPRNRWIRRSTYEGEYFFDVPKEVDILSGSAMMLRGTFLRERGLLDEYTFLYAEEAILHERLAAAGLVSVIVPAGRVVHRHAQASATVRSAVLQAAAYRSFRYYWTEYRHVNRFVVEALILLSRTPRNPFRRPARPHS